MIVLAARNNVPAVYPWREVPTAGGLLSYGPNLEDIVRRAAPYVDRILRGADPAELPVQVPLKFETVVNVKPPGYSTLRCRCRSCCVPTR
jgi:putative tryptophan/tyrosine transport system substrate-binding protein